MNYKNKFFLILAAISSQKIIAKQQITSAQGINRIAFDKATGVLFAGCAAANGDSSLFYLAPQANSTAYTAVPFSTGASNAKNQVINYLSAGHLSDGSNYGAIITAEAGNRSKIILKTLNAESRTTDLTDGQIVPAVATIVGIAATDTVQDGNNRYNFVLAAVPESGQNFLADTDATGDAGFTTGELANDSRLGLIRFHGDDITTKSIIGYLPFNSAHKAVDGGRTRAVIQNATITLKWNAKLQRFYMGITQVRSGRAQIRDGFGVITTKFDQFDDATDQVAITLSCFKINDTFDGVDNVDIVDALTQFGTGADTANSSIVGVCANNVILSCNRFDFMHTTTDKHYILFNGGLGTNAATAPKIYALPLVGPEGNHPGTLALVSNRNQDRLAIDFNTRAQVTNDLFTELYATNPSAFVGNGTLPFAANNAGYVSQLEAVGDTVYCAVAGIAHGNTDEPGLYFSQAIFNNSGAIVRWTDWAKVAPNHISGSTNAIGRCKNFAIDPKRGRIIAISELAPTIVTTTEWKYLTDATSFTGQINRLLDGPCYSSLVLDQHINGFGNRTTGRFALFGGNGKIVVAKTATAKAAQHTAINTSVTDWTAATASAIDMSQGIENAGRIHCLAYTQNDDGFDFLLAGTENGLYIYDADGTGVGFETATANAFVNLNHVESVFNTGTWHAYGAITEPVHKIAIAPAGVIYALVKRTNNNVDRKSATIDSVEYLVLDGEGADSIEDLTQTTVHSQAVLNGLGITDIYDIMIVKGVNDATTLLLATNKGVFDGINNLRFVNGNIIKFFSKPQRARLDLNGTVFGVKELYNSETQNISIKHGLTLGAFSVIQDLANPTSVANRKTNKLMWLNYTTDLPHLTLTTDNASQHTNFLHLNQIRTPLYSNGSLRFFGMSKSSTDTTTDTFNNELVALPYRTDSSEYNVREITPLPDADLQNVQAVYWIDNVGAGYTLVGTDKGILSME